MKKSRNLVYFIGTILLFFLIFSYLPRSYKYDYMLGKISVIEKYDKTNKVYSYLFFDGTIKYEYSLKHNYINKRGLIDKVKTDNECIYVESKKLDNFSVCKNENGYYSTYYDNEIEGKVIDEYEHINVFDYNKRKYYIWNYFEFIVLTEDDHNKVELFENDVYELDLVTKLGKNHLVIADYNQKYKFDLLYLINTQKDNVKKILLNREVYFNSYILGTYKKSIYLYDLQKELIYKINPFKEEISKTSYEILIDDNWEDVSINKLNKKDIKFETNEYFKYVLVDGNLYYETSNIKIKVTDLEVTNIVESNLKEAYFISGDTLYFIDIHEGIKKIMSYSEWNFASKNIYIF